jgi:hypothetical protein
LVDGPITVLTIVGNYLYYFDDPTSGPNNLYRLRRINLGTNVVTTVAGGIVSALGGDYVPAAGVALNGYGYGLSGVGSNLVFFEVSGGGMVKRLRMIWNP